MAMRHNHRLRKTRSAVPPRSESRPVRTVVIRLWHTPWSIALSVRVESVDREFWQAIQQENGRQEEHIELIASENYTSPAMTLLRVCS
jgi:hypothetical protein